jgi:electron transfer flavoprotein alpha subunit
MILVLCEVKDHHLKKASAESLSAAQSVAASLQVPLAAVFIGADAPGHEEAQNYGAQQIFTCFSPNLAAYSSDLYAETLISLAQAKKAKVVMGAATALGKDVLPRVAARLQGGYANEIIEILPGSGSFQVIRPIYAGKAWMTLEFTDRVAVLSTRPNLFSLKEKKEVAQIETLAAPTQDFKAIVKELLAKSTNKPDLTEANIIVSGGRGMKEGSNFKILEELADALGGVVGASRAAVDAGWGLPHSMQVGQTGKVVSPTLYIACGISGAIQHLAGMSSSKYIVAINKDSEAPIFKIASYGIVGDLFEVVPALSAAARALKLNGG